MKRIDLSILLLLALMSCTNNNNDSRPPELIGTWLLIEQYLDQGDGSGDFVVVNSDKIIEFFNDGNIVSNGSLCSMDTSSNQETTGTYDTMNNTLMPDNCNNNGMRLVYEISNNRLILNFPCFETCQQKFRKLN